MRFIFVFLTLILFSITSAYAATALIKWDKNPESELIEGYNVSQDDVVIAPMFDGTEIEVGITGGECFHITAVNLIGESPPSEKSCAPNTVPGAPTGTKIINIHIVIN